ncbi:hypothetical protein PCAR4_170086 [Paraburkholderia caribensis]|nr:hypothetical protein PCAR4_170086 [Paraburkholderia caribensis]
MGWYVHTRSLAAKGDGLESLQSVQFAVKVVYPEGPVYLIYSEPELWRELREPRTCPPSERLIARRAI